LSGVGANAQAGGSGRLLTGLFPVIFGSQRQVVAWSKDYQFFQSGNVKVQAIAVRKH
jgi:hypothetical protein